jgi:predicted DNA-binding transcriptional regulator YafY
VTDPAERLVNLALFVGAAPEPVTAARIQAQVAGYPTEQAEATFLRMFERDKEDLLAAGIALSVVRSGDSEAYRLDREATFAGELELTPEEALLVRGAGTSMLADPSFPFAEDLRLALSKVSAASGDAPTALSMPVVALTADEDPTAQAATVAEAAVAIAAHKILVFGYTNVAGRASEREVEPYGVFARDGRWYLVGLDRAAGGIRVFAVARIEDLDVNAVRPKHPDFTAPEGFTISDWMLLPFQYGPDRVEAVLRLSGPAAARADALACGQGALSDTDAAGSILWRVPVADARALVAWAIEHGPGIEVLEPAETRACAEAGLRKVVAAHVG